MSNAYMPRESAIDMARVRAHRALRSAREYYSEAVSSPNFTHVSRAEWRRMACRRLREAAYWRNALAVEKSYHAIAWEDGVYGPRYGSVML